MVDVLAGRPAADETDRRPGPRRLVAAVLLAVVVAAVALVRPGGGPVRSELELRGLDGTVLAGDSYVRFHLELRVRGADRIDEVQVRVQGADSTGLVLTPDDELDRVVVQVDVSPRCPVGQLDVGTVQARLTGADGWVVRRVPLPVEGQVERLLSYQCRDPSASS